MVRKPLIVTAAVVAATCAVPALAADNGIYVGASVGQSGVNFNDTIEGTHLNYSADSTGYKLIAGWRFLDWLSVEANYVDLGSGDDTVQGTKVETSVNGAVLSAVGFLPVGPVDLFARVGLVNWSADAKLPSFSLKSSENGTDFAYGIGAQFRLGSLGFRAEYERYDVSDFDTVDMVSVGATWTFF